LLANNFRSEIWLPEKTLKYQINQIYTKKIPCYLVIGKKEIENERLKLTYAYSSPKKEVELTEKELLEKLKLENSIIIAKI
jgi:threonyl-tRNA synthetase